MISIILSLTLIGIIISILIYIINGKLTDKVIRIKKITDKLADGNLDIKSNDEIEDLVYSLKRLVCRLKSYITYIDETTVILNTIAEGNLVIETSHEFDGEFIKIKESLNNQINLLTDIMKKIRSASDNINNSVNQITVSTGTLSQGDNEQASVMEQLSAEISEIYYGIDKNCELVKRTQDVFTDILDYVNTGNDKMRELITSMAEVEKSSLEIGDVIQVINDIDFQTKILAFNANIEASRAGDAGRGFKVVAEEVRDLANKSSEAAKRTALLIDKSMRTVKKGTELVNSTGESLVHIVDKANNTKEIMDEISVVSESQAISVKQIKDVIEQVTVVVQETAHNAEECACTAEELNNQSNILNNIMDKVKFKE